MRQRSTVVALLTIFSLLGLLLGACASSPPPAESGAEVAAPAEDVGTFTYWGGLIFSEEANNMLVERIEKWGELRGVEVEVVMINQNETVQRVSAAIEAGTMPDALDMGWGQMLLLNQQEQLQPVDALYDEIGASLGGWLNAANQATDPDLFDGHRYGIPFSLGGNVLYRRADILEPLGFTEAPATWEEVADMSRAAQDPPNYYGMAFALSDVGDANLTQSMLRSWGGRIADDAGQNCTIDSPETRAFLAWITQA